MYVNNDVQASDYCKDPKTVCDPHAGNSFMRGAFTFQRGKWTRIGLTGRCSRFALCFLDFMLRIHQAFIPCIYTYALMCSENE